MGIITERLQFTPTNFQAFAADLEKITGTSAYKRSFIHSSPGVMSAELAVEFSSLGRLRR